MASELNFLIGFTSLNTDEVTTAKEEYELIGDALNRKAHSFQDDMAIAASLDRIKDKHGRNSTLYIEMLNWLGSVSISWADKDFRYELRKARDGVNLLKQVSHGSDEEREKTISLFTSQSSLKEVSKCKKPYELTKACQRRTKPVTANEMKTFNKTGKFKRLESEISDSNSGMTTLQKGLELLSDYPKVVEAIQAEIDLLTSVFN